MSYFKKNLHRGGKCPLQHREFFIVTALPTFILMVIVIFPRLMIGGSPNIDDWWQEGGGSPNISPSEMEIE